MSHTELILIVHDDADLPGMFERDSVTYRVNIDSTR